MLPSWISLATLDANAEVLESIVSILLLLATVVAVFAGLLFILAAAELVIALRRGEQELPTVLQLRGTCTVQSVGAPAHGFRGLIRAL